MLSTCPRCGAPRVATKRFCRACGLDWKPAQGEPAVAPVTPVEQAPADAESGINTAGIIVGAIVAVTLIGGGIVYAQGEADNATREIQADDATPKRTPTARRTPRPTPSADQRAFQDFVGHMTPMSAVIVAGMEDVDGDATRIDVEGLQDSSLDLSRVLADEVQWIEDNPPERCYRKLQAAYARAVTTLHHALDLISEGAFSRDPETLNEGAEQMSAGRRLLNDVPELVRPANRACRR